jgi:hypothetical protein
MLMALLLGLSVTACADTAEEAESEPANEPAKVDEAVGDAPPHVHLTAEAAKRVDIQTAPVQDAVAPPRPTGGAAPAAPGTVRRVVPFAAVLYEANGEAFTYTNPAPLDYVRAKLVIDYVVNGVAVLNDGPPAGTAVVIVGGSELLGAELGVGE